MDAPHYAQKYGHNLTTVLGTKQVVRQAEHHQGDNHKQAHTEQGVHHLFIGGLSEDRFIGVEDQMAAVQNRDREQVDQPDCSRQNRKEPNESVGALAGSRPRCLRDPNNTTYVACADRANGNMIKRG